MRRIPLYKKVYFETVLLSDKLVAVSICVVPLLFFLIGLSWGRNGTITVELFVLVLILSAASKFGAASSKYNKKICKKRASWGWKEAYSMFACRTNQPCPPDVNSRIFELLNRLRKHVPVVVGEDLDIEQEFVENHFREHINSIWELDSIPVEKLPKAYVKRCKKLNKGDKQFMGLHYGDIIRISTNSDSIEKPYTLMHEYTHTITNDEGYTEYLSILLCLKAREIRYFVSGLYRLYAHTVTAVDGQCKCIENVYTACMLYFNWQHLCAEVFDKFEAMSDDELASYVRRNLPVLDGVEIVPQTYIASAYR